jgi:hypothetical protein
VIPCALTTCYSPETALVFNTWNVQWDEPLSHFAVYFNLRRYREGNVYIADQPNHRIHKMTVDGVVSTIAGRGLPSFTFRGFEGAALPPSPSPPPPTILPPRRHHLKRIHPLHPRLNDQCQLFLMWAIRVHLSA